MAERCHSDLKRLVDADQSRTIWLGGARCAACILWVGMEDQAALDNIMTQAAVYSISNSVISAGL